MRVGKAASGPCVKLAIFSSLWQQAPKLVHITGWLKQASGAYDQTSAQKRHTCATRSLNKNSADTCQTSSLTYFLRKKTIARGENIHFKLHGVQKQSQKHQRICFLSLLPSGRVLNSQPSINQVGDLTSAMSSVFL